VTCIQKVIFINLLHHIQNSFPYYELHAKLCRIMHFLLLFYTVSRVVCL
jgi:hypothetical protein